MVLLFTSDNSADVRYGVQLIPGHFTGDFGSGIDTDISFSEGVFTLSSDRQEFRLTGSYLRIHTEEPVTFIGGEVVPRGKPGSRSSTNSSTETGPGDVILKEEYFFLQGDQHRRPWVSGIARVKLPTADESKGLGTGELDYGPGVGLIQPLGKRVNILAELQYVVRGDPPGVDLRNTAWGTLGAQAHITDSVSINIFYEARESVVRGRDAIQDISVGFNQRFSPTLALLVTVYNGISDTAEDYGFSVAFSVKAPR